jgi:hypothetical protein
MTKRATMTEKEYAFHVGKMGRGQTDPANNPDSGPLKAKLTQLERNVRDLWKANTELSAEFAKFKAKCQCQK